MTNKTPQAINEKLVTTFQTRINLSIESESVLDAMSKTLSTVERKLYADFMKGQKITQLKSHYINRYGISARQFNAIRINLEGKIDSILKLNKTYIKDTESAIKKLEKAITSKTRFINRKDAKPNEVKNAKQAIHQKKRKLVNKRLKLAELLAVEKSKKPSLCFGTKKLFKAQYNLIENDYSNHQQWRDDWTEQRNNQFYLLGSKDETAGCQSCVATINPDKTLDFKLLIPESLRENKSQKYITINNVFFQYGQDKILNVLAENATRNPFKKALKQNLVEKNKSFVEQNLIGPLESETRINSQIVYPGKALSYRFLKDKKGYRVFISLEQANKKQISTETSQGCMGLDINEHHISVSEIDKSGNLINTFDVPCSTYGKTTDQAKAIIGDACAHIVTKAQAVNKPIIIEDLDFSKKKQSLDKPNKRYARMISSFSYNLIKQTLKSRALRAGILIYAVNPAYSSLIGRFKFAIPLRLSIHQAAAYVIARRHYTFNENLPLTLKTEIKGVQNTFVRPEQDGTKHVWKLWADIYRKYKKAVHVAHTRKVPIFSPLEISESYPF